MNKKEFELKHIELKKALGREPKLYEMSEYIGKTDIITKNLYKKSGINLLKVNEVDKITNDIINLYLKGFSQLEIARSLGLNQQQVSYRFVKAKRAINYYEKESKKLNKLKHLEEEKPVYCKIIGGIYKGLTGYLTAIYTDTVEIKSFVDCKPIKVIVKHSEYEEIKKRDKM